MRRPLTTSSTRRSYLFYGVPGAGKTSFIQAIAGHCSRSISYLQIDPEMTDVILRSAMEVPHPRPSARPTHPSARAHLTLLLIHAPSPTHPRSLRASPPPSSFLFA